MAWLRITGRARIPCFSGLGQVRRGGQSSDVMHNTRVFLDHVSTRSSRALHCRHVHFIVFTSISLSSLSSRPLHSLPLSSRSLHCLHAHFIVFTSTSLSSRPLHCLHVRFIVVFWGCCGHAASAATLDAMHMVDDLPAESLFHNAPAAASPAAAHGHASPRVAFVNNGVDVTAPAGLAWGQQRRL